MEEDVIETYDEEFEVVDEESGNMPCDTYGMCACSHSCPNYYKCQV